MRNLRRAAKWTGAAVASLLLALGVQSAWSRAGKWISPPPPPVPEQINTLVHIAAQRGFSVQYQATARLHPGGDLSYIFIFKPTLPPQAVIPHSSQLRIYDLRRGSLRLTYRFEPLTSDSYTKRPWTFGIDVLNVSDLDGNGTDEVVASLGLYAADAIPTFPVIVSWRPATDTYLAEPIMSKQVPPLLHGSRDWTRGYRSTMTVWNNADPHERFASYHAEAVHVETGPKPALLGIFYAHARSRAEPRDLEVNVWPLSGEAHSLCTVGTKYPPPPLFIKVIGFFTYDEFMSRLWTRVHSKTYC